jgi:hypothetical protein
MGSQLTEKYVALFILCAKPALTQWYLASCWSHWREVIRSCFSFIVKIFKRDITEEKPG